MNNVKLSIITINYNNCAGLKKTIGSVISQDYKNLEYIIIDGGSTDKSIELIKKYQQHITKWVSEKDNGISDAFNKGLKYVTGDIVGIINSGDYYRNNVFNLIMEYFKSSDCDLICGDLGLIQDTQLQKIKKSKVNKIKNYMSICHPTVFFKSFLYSESGGFSARYRIAMDYDFILRAITNGHKIDYLNCHIAYMELDGVSNTNEFKGLMESYEIKNKYINNKLLNKIELLYLIIKSSTKKVMVYFNLYNEA